MPSDARTQCSEDFRAALRASLAQYAPKLLQGVAERLCRDPSRSNSRQRLERILAALDNVPLIDRRLRELEPQARALLTLLYRGRRWRWGLPQVLELAAFAGSANGLDLILSLCEAGLLFAERDDAKSELERFEDWVPHVLRAGARGLLVPPGVAERAANVPAPMGLEPTTAPQGELQPRPEADGLEMLLRLAALWQKLRSAPPRIKQFGGLFKKDRQRLEEDPLLNASGPNDLIEIPNAWAWHLVWGAATGMLEYDWTLERIQVASRPEFLLAPWPTVLEKVWAANCEVEFQLANASNNPAEIALPWPASAGIAVLTALGQLDPRQWCCVDDLAVWLAPRHPLWKSNWTEENEAQAPWRIPRILTDWLRLFLLGLGFPLRLVEAAQDAEGRWFVRLGNWGRGVLGLAPMPTPSHYPRTLLVQPNLEIIAYRQGLTPELIGQLSRFCTWKSLGAACTLQLGPESVYQGLETGLSHDDILRLLQQHAVRELPPSVLEALKTWAAKHERVTVYASATLLEFPTAEDLQAAVARGVPVVLLGDRVALVEREADLDYRQFRLLGTRDYGLPADRCVSIGEDGVTLSVDLARSDLLLESELQRFAEPEAKVEKDGRRIYRLTPSSLQRARRDGLSVETLEEWFARRTGSGMPPAVRLFLAGTEASGLRVTSLLVLQTPTPLLADGLMQWPDSRRLIRERLGPTALAVDETHLPTLLELLRSLGIQYNPFRRDSHSRTEE